MKHGVSNLTYAAFLHSTMKIRTGLEHKCKEVQPQLTVSSFNSGNFRFIERFPR